MATILEKRALTFDDVLLVPQHSDLDSRSEADTSTDLGFCKLRVPIISANMDSITGPDMVRAMHSEGALGILHRYVPFETVKSWVRELNQELGVAVPSIGVGVSDGDSAIEYFIAGAEAVCIDVAHGDCARVVELIREIKKQICIHIIAGNVATYDGALRLIDAGADTLKVGIGPGSLCTTRLITGHGVPQLTAIMDVAEAIKTRDRSVKLIADGGIRNSGDIAKALAAGADCVMVGALFAGTEETPGEVVEDTSRAPRQELNQVCGTWVVGPVYPKAKAYRGMASRDAQIDWRGRVSGTPEGEAVMVPLRGSVKPIVQSLAAGIRSGMSYSGASNLKELRDNAIFQLVSANTVRENGVHYGT